MPTTTTLLRDDPVAWENSFERGRLAVLSLFQDGLACVGTIVLLSQCCDMPPAKPRWHANSHKWIWISQQSAGLRPR
eukprot:8936305-Pyramimonas_sp.AAC.1